MSHRMSHRMPRRSADCDGKQLEIKGNRLQHKCNMGICEADAKSAEKMVPPAGFEPATP